MESTGNKISSAVVAKAGLWYTVCNFLTKTLAFITVPLFARIMTKTDMGNFGNFSSWMSILVVLTSFDLAQSIIRSKLEHSDDMDSYIWSILSLSSLVTLFAYVFFCIFPGFFSNLLDVDSKYFHIMFIYLLTEPAYNMLITKQRAYYKYKTFVLLTFIVSILATALSVCFVLLFEDKLSGRIYGHCIAFAALGAAIYVYLAVKGKKIKLEYWKYAVVICLPLVPHALSLYLLSSSDKIIVTRLSGAEYTAVYGIAYSCYHIATVLFQSLNKAWAPWLLDNLHIQNYSEIKDVSKKYVGIFFIFMIGILLLAPEVVLILGGKSYYDAIYCIPPLIASCMLQLIYTMYVNIEFYEKKTITVGIGTIIAAAINIGLNFLIIPMFPERGHVVAAYTTLVGYAVLFVIHYFIVRHMKMDHVYDIKFLLIVIGLMLAISLGVNKLYDYRYIRYAVVLVYIVGLIILLVKNKKLILSIFKKDTKKAAPQTDENPEK